MPDTSKQINTIFSLNDGQFLFDILETSKNHITGRSRGNFTLLPKKGLNIPGSVYDENLQLEICKNFIREAKALDVDGYGLSFIQNSSVIEELRQEIGNKVLVSKIENSEGLANADEIIASSDAIMIDRGDLAAEIGFTSLYNAVEDITRKTKVNGKPLIMATENLESMSNRETPSKSEVISLAHSVLPDQTALC